MARLVVLINAPHRLSVAEAEAWLREETGALRALDSVSDLAVLQLRSPSELWSKQRDWMIEIRCDGPDAATMIVGHGAWLSLLADFQQLGLHPEVALVDETSKPAGNAVGLSQRA